LSFEIGDSYPAVFTTANNKNSVLVNNIIIYVTDMCDIALCNISSRREKVKEHS
jgi:hypothetical protein